MPVAQCDICSSTRSVCELQPEYQTEVVQVTCAECRMEIEELLAQAIGTFAMYRERIKQRVVWAWIRRKVGLDPPSPSQAAREAASEQLLPLRNRSGSGQSPKSTPQLLVDVPRRSSRSGTAPVQPDGGAADGA